jgi:riboflavin synthase
VLGAVNVQTMFTGLVSDIGSIEKVSKTEAGIELGISCAWNDLAEGESVAVNGVCLTVRGRGKGFFTCAAVVTTTEVTTIGAWTRGRRVNLERAMRPTDRLGGHIVQGHVDGVATVTRSGTVSDALVLELALPPGLGELMVERGSVAVDGVSLTVTALPGPDSIELAIIEYTRRHTTLGDLKVGDVVHVEADVLAKHVRRLLAGQREP